MCFSSQRFIQLCPAKDPEKLVISVILETEKESLTMHGNCKRVLAYEFFCLSAHLSISVCLSLRPSVCPSFHLSDCLSLRLSVCLSSSVHLSVRLPVRLSVCPSVCLSVYLSVLSLCLLSVSLVLLYTSITNTPSTLYSGS